MKRVVGAVAEQRYNARMLKLTIVVMLALLLVACSGGSRAG